MARSLREHYHVYALDLRGHGNSAWAPGAMYSIAEHVLDLSALLASLVEKGRCLTRMQRKDEARELLARIVHEHPEGVEGGAARQLLMNLDIESGRH